MPPENLNAAGPHGPLIRQPLASSLRFRYKCAVKSLTVSSVHVHVQQYCYIVSQVSICKLSWFEKATLSSDESAFEFGGDLA
jgi:hypothetical protein